MRKICPGDTCEGTWAWLACGTYVTMRTRPKVPVPSVAPMSKIERLSAGSAENIRRMAVTSSDGALLASGMSGAAQSAAAG